MLTTSDLINRYVAEGRADKASALCDYLEVVLDVDGEEIYPRPEVDDTDLEQLMEHLVPMLEPDTEWN